VVIPGAPQGPLPALQADQQRYALGIAYPVDSARVQEAEAQLGRRLPASLSARLQADNGGEVTWGGEAWQLFPVWDPTDRRTTRKTANHLVLETMQARRWAGFPGGAVAVAANGSGDLLVLRAGRDVIEVWRHDTREVTEAIGLAL
jgi:hypothetical protein